MLAANLKFASEVYFFRGGWGGCPSIQYPRCAGDATLTSNRNSSAVGYQDYPGQAALQSRVVKSQADESKGLRA